MSPESRLVTIMNGAALALALSIGHRTGLLDALAQGPTTAEGLADRAHLDERYVREWLGAVTTGRITQHDPDAMTYWLEPDMAGLVTRGGEVNAAVFTQYLAVLGAVEDDIVECFCTGAGVPYERFPRFHDVMAEDSAQNVTAALDEAILPLVPGIQQRLADGIEVLDVGCGRGGAVLALARTYPASHFVGIDLNAEAIEHARAAAEATRVTNTEFRELDATTLADKLPAASVDLATTFDAIHDQARPGHVLRGIRHVLREDGVYLAQDINASGSHHGDMDHAIGPFLYTVSMMHCMTVSLAQGGEGLGTMWGIPTALALLEEAGFSDVQTHELPHDAQNVYYVCRS